MPGNCFLNFKTDVSLLLRGGSPFSLRVRMFVYVLMSFVVYVLMFLCSYGFMFLCFDVFLICLYMFFSGEVKPMWNRSELEVRPKWIRSETEEKSKWNRCGTEGRSM